MTLDFKKSLHKWTEIWQKTTGLLAAINYNPPAMLNILHTEVRNYLFC